MPAVIVELDEAARDALDERFALEDLGIAALGRQATRLAERRAEVAHDIPVTNAFAVSLDFVQRVILVLDVRTVEHHQDDEEPLIRPHADERVLLPRPLADMLDGFVGQPKTTARLRVDAFVVLHRERRQKILGRLVVADG